MLVGIGPGNESFHLRYVNRKLMVGRRMLTSIIFAIIGDHKHDLPFEDIVIYQTTRDTWQIFGSLHILELPSKETGGSRCSLSHYYNLEG